MVRTCLSIVAVFLVPCFISGASAQEGDGKLNEHLSCFEPMIGKTWKGEFVNERSGKPQHDISRWERALNGQAVRILHSIDDGVYGGETIMMWDKAQSKIVYWYFTTAGFTTKGTMEPGDKSWNGIEEVAGNSQGITKVKSTSTLKDDGTLHVKSEYFAQEKWVPGHEVIYKLAPDAQVKFK